MKKILIVIPAYNEEAIVYQTVMTLRDFCEKNGVHLEELRAGSRRAGIPPIRSELALKLLQECGLSLAEIGRQLGVTTSAVSKALRRGKGGNST